MKILSWLFASSEKASGVAAVPSPPDAAEETAYLRRCLTQEFHNEEETRTFRSDPAFAVVLTAFNSQQYAQAIKEARKLLPRFTDFDLVYKWLGSAHLATQDLEAARRILSEGLEKAKRKYMLLTDLGDTEWQLGNPENSLYWLAQSLHCMGANPTEYNAYLLLSYMAKGVSLPEEANRFLNRVDQLRAGQIRLPAAHAERLMNHCRKGQTEPMRKVIRELASKYLKSA